MSETKTPKKHRKSNGEGSIYQRADKRWCATIQIGTKDDGKKITKSFYGKQRKDVVKQLEEYKQLSNKHSHIIKDKTLDEYILKWQTTVKINELKPTSYDRLESTIRTHIIGNVGYYQISDINSQIVQELINKLHKEKLSYSSIKKVYNALSGCFKYAINNRHIQFNPMNTVKLPATHKFEKKQMRILSEDEVKIFKTNCTLKYSNGEYIYPLGYGMILLLNTGLRLGEALALKWSDINFDSKTITVSNNLVMAVDRNNPTHNNKRVQINQDTTKTESGDRIIPLNKTATDALEHLKTIRYFGEDSYILSTKENKPNKPRNFCRTYETILERSKIEHCGIHTLRHTFASHLFLNGVDIKTISVLLGHSSVEITYKTYIHLIKEQKSSAVKLLDEI